MMQLNIVLTYEFGSRTTDDSWYILGKTVLSELSLLPRILGHTKSFIPQKLSWPVIRSDSLAFVWCCASVTISVRIGFDGFDNVLMEVCEPCERGQSVPQWPTSSSFGAVITSHTFLSPLRWVLCYSGWCSNGSYYLSLIKTVVWFEIGKMYASPGVGHQWSLYARILWHDEGASLTTPSLRWWQRKAIQNAPRLFLHSEAWKHFYRNSYLFCLADMIQITVLKWL